MQMFFSQASVTGLYYKHDTHKTEPWFDPIWLLL